MCVYATLLLKRSIYKHALRALRSFDLVLLGDWERDPEQRFALLNVLASDYGDKEAKAMSNWPQKQVMDRLSRLSESDVARLLGMARHTPGSDRPFDMSAELPSNLSPEETEFRDANALDVQLFQDAINLPNAATSYGIAPAAKTCPQFFIRKKCVPSEARLVLFMKGRELNVDAASA